jgi:opacity protein-like surface antigen
MRLHAPRIALLAAASFAASAPAAQAQTSAWSFDFGASTVLTSMTGSLTSSEITSPIDLDLAKLSEDQASFTVDFDVWNGDWGLLTGIQLLDYSLSTATEINNVFTRELQETIGELTVARRLAPGAHVYAGVRTWSTGVVLQLSEPTPATLDGSDSWVDPVVGGHVERAFDEGWFVALDADVGGLGISSNLTWKAVGGVGYRVSSLFSVLAEYSLLAVDYTTDARALDGTVTYDTMRHGPRIGARLVF